MRLAGFTEEEIDEANLSELLVMQKAMNGPFNTLGGYLVLHAKYTALWINRPSQPDQNWENAEKQYRELLTGTYDHSLTIQKHKEMVDMNEEYYSRYQQRKGAKSK